jgi:hypothetical protein
VQAENLVVNDGSEGQIVKEFGEDLPHVRISVLSEALVVETIPAAILKFKQQLTPG